jgi:hypothetical protein
LEDWYEEFVKEDDVCDINRCIVKCPEVRVRLNQVEVIALVDTGSQVNGISQEWFDRNRDKMGRVEMLNLANTTVKGALGNRSKLIRKQVLLSLCINNIQMDVVFLIIPALSRDCMGRLRA